MKYALTSLTCAFTFLAAAAAPDNLPVHAASATRLQCDVVGPGDISMAARFEQRSSGRRKFKAEFEAAPGGIFAVGQRMTVFVADTKVGTDRLRKIAGDDLKGEIQLDDAAGPGDDEKPFPSGFPTVVRNTHVAIAIGRKTVIGCNRQ